jgi:hypothetical protein
MHYLDRVELVSSSVFQMGPHQKLAIVPNSVRTMRARTAFTCDNLHPAVKGKAVCSI